MNVLSLFDGISCGQLALQRAGVKVDKYFLDTERIRFFHFFQFISTTSILFHKLITIGYS